MSGILTTGSALYEYHPKMNMSVRDSVAATNEISISITFSNLITRDVPSQYVQRRVITILIRVYCKMGDTGATGSTYLMTLDQLQQYHDTTLESEAADRASMDFIIKPATSGIQQNLIQWASAGFPSNYQVLSVSLIHPSPCSDGVRRDILAYIQYLTGSNIVELTTNFQSNFLGIRFSYVISANNCVNLHASKFNTGAEVNNTVTNLAPY